jgi:hypothetical protein
MRDWQPPQSVPAPHRSATSVRSMAPSRMVARTTRSETAWQWQTITGDSFGERGLVGWAEARQR